MGAGMLPIALGLGAADSSFRSPMAIAVIGGLITSTVLSLLVVPVVFTYVDDASSGSCGCSGAARATPISRATTARSSASANAEPAASGRAQRLGCDAVAARPLHHSSRNPAL